MNKSNLWSLCLRLSLMAPFVWCEDVVSVSGLSSLELSTSTVCGSVVPLPDEDMGASPLLPGEERAPGEHSNTCRPLSLTSSSQVLQPFQLHQHQQYQQQILTLNNCHLTGQLQQLTTVNNAPQYSSLHHHPSNYPVTAPSFTPSSLGAQLQSATAPPFHHQQQYSSSNLHHLQQPRQQQPLPTSHHNIQQQPLPMVPPPASNHYSTQYQTPFNAIQQQFAALSTNGGSANNSSSNSPALSRSSQYDSSTGSNVISNNNNSNSSSNNSSIINNSTLNNLINNNSSGSNNVLKSGSHKLSQPTSTSVFPSCQHPTLHPSYPACVPSNTSTTSATASALNSQQPHIHPAHPITVQVRDAPHAISEPLPPLSHLCQRHASVCLNFCLLLELALLSASVSIVEEKQKF